MDTLTKIQAVINTLNIISVSGEANLDRLLGCIQVLNGLKAELEEEKNNEGAAP